MAKKTAKKAAKTAKKTPAPKPAKKTATRSPKDDANAQVLKDFKTHVNMTPAAIDKFLKSQDSKKVGFKQGGVGGTGESVGHKSGRRPSSP